MQIDEAAERVALRFSPVPSALRRERDARADRAAALWLVRGEGEYSIIVMTQQRERSVARPTS
jgi:hypothetical protein